MNNTVPYQAPHFSLNDAGGVAHSLSDYHGKWLVVFFYPKNDTPGCTIEVCGFRDAHEALIAKKATVLGISRDGSDSHSKFQAKYDLCFTLLSDPTHTVMDAYGAWGKKMFGHEGVLRKTFIIDPSGKVVKIYGRVKPIGHAQQVLADLDRLQTA